MTLDQLQQIAPKTTQVVCDALNAAALEYYIDSPLRLAMFLGQLAHESEGFTLTHELWGPTPAQRNYERPCAGSSSGGMVLLAGDKSQIPTWQKLGNLLPGDGYKYRGRGYIQITGRANHRRVAQALSIDCLNHPELLELPVNAARSAGWYWTEHKLNPLADDGDLLTVTIKINGGTNGLPSRAAYYAKALAVLGAVPACVPPPTTA